MPTLSVPCRWILGAVVASFGSAALAESNPQALAKAIDSEVLKVLEAKKVPLSARTDDAEFLRRVYLDIAGVLPSADRAAAFLDSQAPNKRARLIDDLLASPEHARQMADMWKELLIPKTAAAARRDQIPLFNWLNKSFTANMPLDKLFHELLTANGMQDTSPATTFYIVHESVDMVADRVSRVLLGVQLQCAQCHDHPFADWKQDEYWAFAGFFSKVGTLYERSPQGMERYGAGENGKRALMVPDSAKKVPPRFLRGEQPKLEADKPYLPVLASWMTAADNPYFARAMVNRWWYHFFGRGLVNPVDGMNKNNAATHPELLDLLARELVASGFDARFLMRAICLSETYQRSSRPLEGNKADDKLYSHMPLRVLLPFQLHDSWEIVLSIGDAKPPEAATPDPKSERRVHGSRNGFASFFAAEEGSLPTEYKAGIPQALRLMNGRDNTRISRAIPVVLKTAKTPPEAIERLYLMTVTRRPTPAELAALTPQIGQGAAMAAQAYGDILWALLNSTEFITNH